MNFTRITSVLWIGAMMMSGCHSGHKKLWTLPGNIMISAVPDDQQQWGLAIEQRGNLFFLNENPIRIEIYHGADNIEQLASGYEQLTFDNDVLTATGSITHGGESFYVKDTWDIDQGVLRLNRHLEVSGESSGGFMSGTGFIYSKPASRDSVKIFAPGMIYGTSDYLTKEAIGGSACKDHIRIREDRLPAPMFGVYFKDGRSFTLLNINPDARTTREESHDMEVKALIDERFRFGAAGADFDQENPVIGYWFPGSEGGITYRGLTYPFGQVKKWSRRYHPIQSGLQQDYQLSFRIADNEHFSEYYHKAWRWAWSTLRPGLNPHDIELVKQSLMKMLGENVETHNGITGIRKFIPAPRGMDTPVASKTMMGFTGKALESANFLLEDSIEEDHPLGERHRAQGEAIIKTFLNLDLAPPAGEGFTFDGVPEVTRGANLTPVRIVYMRSFGDGLKELLKAAKREREYGIEHPDWIAWARSFADWLLPQQGEDGGFPRTWKPLTGEVADPSPESSYTAIPFLVLLTELTGEEHYAEAALRTAELCWNTSQASGIFIGGTIDNPNVIDKEAGTLSLEAYLMLYHYTSDKKWLDRAVMAANFAETWIYVWDVPMPDDEDNSELPWKKGLTTVGMQLISTGHSLSDQYMAFDVDEYAELYLLTGDQHYYDVAMILLHNTKTMLALPGREFDLKGPGWMQEHWSMAPVRGFGIHRGWLPWVSTSLLNGIIELEALDQALYHQMINPEK